MFFIERELESMGYQKVFVKGDFILWVKSPKKLEFLFYDPDMTI